MLVRSVCCPDKWSTYVLGIDADRKECSYKRVGYRTEMDLGRLCGADVLCDICLPFVSTRVLQKGHARKRMDPCRNR